MNDETSKKLINLLKIISVILVVAFFSKIIAFLGGLLTSILAFFVLIYFSTTSYLSTYSWFSVRFFDMTLIIIACCIALNIIFLGHRRFNCERTSRSWI